MYMSLSCPACEQAGLRSPGSCVFDWPTPADVSRRGNIRSRPCTECWHRAKYRLSPSELETMSDDWYIVTSGGDADRGDCCSIATHAPYQSWRDLTIAMPHSDVLGLPAIPSLGRFHLDRDYVPRPASDPESGWKVWDGWEMTPATITESWRRIAKHMSPSKAMHRTAFGS